jgi:hypothetical protein
VPAEKHLVCCPINNLPKTDSGVDKQVLVQSW